MKNQEVAKCFAELAGLLEFKGENSFRVSSYRRAARIIEEVTADVAELARDGKLQELPGVGEGIAKKIVEYLETGKMKRLEEARQGVPPGIVDMLDVPELIRTAAATGTALEINSNPERLDLTDIYCRMAKEHGVKLAIGTDSHSTGEFRFIELGVAVARRGWLGPDHILNTQARPKFGGKH